MNTDQCGFLQLQIARLTLLHSTDYAGVKTEPSFQGSGDRRFNSRQGGGGGGVSAPDVLNFPPGELPFQRRQLRVKLALSGDPDPHTKKSHLPLGTPEPPTPAETGLQPGRTDGRTPARRRDAAQVSASQIITSTRHRS